MTGLAPVETQLFINGDVRPASHGHSYEIFNLARPCELVRRAAAATPDDVETAMRGAHASFPAWSALNYSARAEMLRKVAAAITQDMDEVETRAQIFTREHGKILFETRLEISRIGDAIIGHPLVRYVNFTGSVDVGRHVMKVAAENITPVTLALGGNDAGIGCNFGYEGVIQFQGHHCISGAPSTLLQH